MNLDKKLFFSAILVGNSLLSQNHITTQNGVNVYESKGVETKSAQHPENPSKNVEDWNLAECDKAIADIAIKISSLNKQDKDYPTQIQSYQETILTIESRKKDVINKK